MFTGIITHTTKITAVKKQGGSLLVRFEKPRGMCLKEGDSISISGICSTVIFISTQHKHTYKLENVRMLSGDFFEIEYIPETIFRTTVGAWKKGTVVNLELPLRVSDRLGGHIVQGHVDFAAKILNVFSPPYRGGARPTERSFGRVRGGVGFVLRVSLPRKFANQIVEKGYVTVDGISFTVSDVKKSSVRHSNILKNVGMWWFEISLIPYTRAHTNLSALKKGDRVNVETDIVGKYLVR